MLGLLGMLPWKVDRSVAGWVFVPVMVVLEKARDLLLAGLLESTVHARDMAVAK